MQKAHDLSVKIRNFICCFLYVHFNADGICEIYIQRNYLKGNYYIEY
ncbi:hypothetical protein ACFP3I_12905 [Chryseobacterium arachidis]